MNQQRARRFLAVREGIIKKKMDEEAEAIGLMLAGGKAKEEEKQKMEVDDHDEPKFKFDSNSITPGTAFMSRVSDWMQQYIVNRINLHPSWKNVSAFYFLGATLCHLI